MAQSEHAAEYLRDAAAAHAAAVSGASLAAPLGSPLSGVRAASRSSPTVVPTPLSPAGHCSLRRPFRLRAWLPHPPLAAPSVAGQAPAARSQRLHVCGCQGSQGRRKRGASAEPQQQQAVRPGCGSAPMTPAGAVAWQLFSAPSSKALAPASIPALATFTPGTPSRASPPGPAVPPRSLAPYPRATSPGLPVARAEAVTAQGGNPAAGSDSGASPNGRPAVSSVLSTPGASQRPWPQPLEALGV